MLKKLFTFLLAAFILCQVFPTNIYADEYEEVQFQTLESEYVDYNKNPLVRTMTINNEERTIYFNSTEGYYYDSKGNKVVIIHVENAEHAYMFEPRSVSMNKFLSDFEYTGSFVPKEFKLSNISSVTIDLVTNLIADMALAYLGIPSGYRAFIIASANIVAAAILDNPPEYSIRLNIKYYKNKRCSTYLNGQTFNMVAKGKVTPRMYYYSWTENPSLGVVDGNCKVASQTYPYSSGYGQ